MGSPIHGTPSRRRRSRALRAASPNSLSAEPLSVQQAAEVGSLVGPLDDMKSAVRAENLDSTILVMKAAESRSRCDGAEPLNRPMNGSVLAQSSMSSRFIVIGDKLAKDPAQHDGMVYALAPDRSDQSFGKAVLPRRTWRDGFVTDAHGSQSARRSSGRTPESDAELIAKEQVLGFKPARRLKEVNDEHCEGMQEREHRSRSCDDSTRRRDSEGGWDFRKGQRVRNTNHKIRDRELSSK